MSPASLPSTEAVSGRDPLVGRPFDELPADALVRAFGVEYAHLRPPEGGDLFVTRYGWPHAEALLPDRWYTGQWFATHGEKLPGSTGHVYHLRTRPEAGTSADLVVKFSRVAQEVPIVVESTFPGQLSPDLLAEARFNSPLEEFGLVMELRRSVIGPPGPPILTQRPLAIYAPPEEFDLWELGRSKSGFSPHLYLLAEDQNDAIKAIEMDIRRIYVLLYGWVKGRDAQQCFEAGDLDPAEFGSLAARVERELAGRGFRVLDNKPKHYILRKRRAGGGLLRRSGGEPVYALVDFELLQRTPEHQHRFEAARRTEYWQLQSGAPQAAAVPAPSHLQTVRVFGLDYVFGTTPDGGRLWVAGHEPALFDYFLPDRWRRTRRLKLSAASEVYRTRTRDNIDVVYRRSRVGLRPRVDPLSAAGKRIREAGYNSPFEEVAIAGRLRQLGIACVTPRAIFRTGHESTMAARLRDERRFAGHAEFRSPEQPPAPVLCPNYDYYTIWDTYRGLDPPREPGPDRIGGVLGLDRARDDGLVSPEEAKTTIERARDRLTRRGLPADGLADDEFALCLDDRGEPKRNADGLEVALSLDALTAYEYGLLGEGDYLALMRRMDERLRAADFEWLDPNGRHLLLSLDSEGRLGREASGGPHVTLCNFSLIRGLYRPLR